MRKLGGHVLYTYSGDLGHPAVCKLVNASVATVLETRQRVGPKTLLIVRWVEQDQSLDNSKAKAAEWFNRHRADLWAMRELAPICAEGLNEVPDSQALAYRLFEMERLNLLHGIGVNACVGNFSVGCPDIPAWTTYQPMLDAMRPGDFLGLHEYWSDRADLQNQWHVGRWRLIPQLRNVPLVVTECGRDRVELAGRPGWRLTCNAEEFLEDLRIYDRLCGEFPNVVGATPFTIGEIRDKRWEPFSCNDIWARAVAEQEEEEVTKVPFIPLIGSVVAPMLNTQKKWYSANTLFGRYDDHPEKAEDYNLESGANTDLGEPLVAMYDGVIIGARDYKGGHGKVVGLLGREPGGQLVTAHYKHMDRIVVVVGQIVQAGDAIGTLGNAGGHYAGAHLHLEIIVGDVPGPIASWQDGTYNYQQPSAWLKAHGVDMARLTAHDGR